MKKAGVVMMAFTLAVAGAATGPRLTVTLRVVNEGGIPDGSLGEAEKEAVRIFRESGIDLVWLACESGHAEWSSGNPCQRDFGPAEFWIRIVTRQPPATSGDMLGFTILDPAQGRGSAGVYFPAAEQLAIKWDASAGQILGAAVAHEVGHLLLGAQAHSRDGIMNGHWTRAEFALLRGDGLNFSRAQASRLRAAAAGECYPTSSTVSRSSGSYTPDANGRVPCR